MDNKELAARIDTYIEDNWDAVVEDIATLVRIPSFEEPEKVTPDEPFGPGPCASLTAALEMAERMGFETHDLDGYIGFADFPGTSETQLGIIGHTDVVPAGPGWSFEPFDVTRKDGYLIGRGVIDDKGPSVVALHALKFWKEQGAEFPYTIRFLFGANEESGMRDVPYYQQRYADPAFLFTPDAEFPVCYGEKGSYDGELISMPIPERRVMEFEGGMATNAVPGVAYAVVQGEAANLPNTSSITVTEIEPGLVRLDAAGKSAHASTPEQGVNAIGLIVDYLLEHDLCSVEERIFFELEHNLLDFPDGSELGLATSDEHFGPLTVVGGIITIKDDSFVQTFDSRYPTTITGEGITQHMKELAAAAGATFQMTGDNVPFLVEPTSPMIQALLNTYNEATGEQAKPFTMGGGTYARHFSSAASFGPEMPWVEDPAWVGGMHGPNEGVSEELLKKSLRIYILTIQKLMELDLG